MNRLGILVSPSTRGLVAALALIGPAALATSGCNTNDEPYKAAPAWTGRKPSLPAPPTINVTIKNGDAYTIAGVIHQLHSRIHEKEVNGKELTIVGYIVDSNIPTAPACAIHDVGKKDPENCKSELPSFWIADTKDGKPRIRVLGWAKNFATVHEAMKKYDKLKEPPKELVKDELFSTEVPFPLPAVGAKVKVTGTYGFAFTKATTGVVSDPDTGVMTYKKVDQLEAAPAPAAFQNKK